MSNAGKDVIIRKCAEKGIEITRNDITAHYGGNGGYSIDGMPWDEWLDAMTQQ